MIVSEPIAQRLRCRVGRQLFDLFVYDAAAAVRLLREGTQAFVVTMLADAVPLSGDVAMAESLRSLAKEALATVPAPTEADLFRASCEPFDLLRAFEASCADPHTAAFVLAALITASAQAFHTVRRVRTTNVRGFLDVLEALDREAVAALRTVLRASIDDLCRDAAPVRHMVRLLAGEEPRNDRRLTTFDRRPPHRPQSRAPRRTSAGAHVRTDRGGESVESLQPPALARLPADVVSAIHVGELESMSRLQLLTIQHVHGSRLDDVQRRCIAAKLAVNI